MRKIEWVSALVAIVSMGTVSGCAIEGATEDGKKGGGSPLATQIDLPEPLVTDGPLKAYQTPEELAAGAKADALVVSASYDELFAPTAAPAKVRAVAEWEHVDSVIVHWDAALEGFYRTMVDALHRVSNVHLVTTNIAESNAAKAKLEGLGMNSANLKFFEYANESIWTRDFGPITVEKLDGQPAFVDLQYYPNRNRDNAVPTLMSEYYDIDVYRPGIQAEGGNFMTNGNGICAFTDVIPQRNGLPVQAVVDRYKQFFGCDQVIVAKHLPEEGTGHIDMWAKFAQEDVVLVGQYDALRNPTQAATLEENAKQFAAVTLADGRKMKVIRIPMPNVRKDAQGYGVFESFTNSLVINGTVIIPKYDDAKGIEADALAAYKAAFPAGYKFKTVPSSDVIEWGGAVHCTTMSYSVGPIPDLGTLPTPITAETLFQVNPVLPIADRGETDSSITVPTSLTGNTDEVVVDVTIEHTYTGDLVIALEHNGVSEVLFTGEGAGQNIRQKFTTDAFRGQDKSGEWRLVVADTASQDEGTLYAWTLAFGSR
jgi:agmatine/peptidylarginine deiminase